jgi:hypothetical protein
VSEKGSLGRQEGRLGELAVRLTVIELPEAVGTSDLDLNVVYCDAADAGSFHGGGDGDGGVGER